MIHLVISFYSCIQKKKKIKISLKNGFASLGQIQKEFSKTLILFLFLLIRSLEPGDPQDLSDCLISYNYICISDLISDHLLRFIFNCVCECVCVAVYTDFLKLLLYIGEGEVISNYIQMSWVNSHSESQRGSCRQ